MTRETIPQPGALERGYRRWLRWYPRSFRLEHEAEIVAVLVAGAGAGRRRPELAECVDLVRGGLGMRLRPRVARSDRAVLGALRLVCLGAALELVAAVTLLATAGDVGAAVAAAHPGAAAAEWYGLVADRAESTALAACAAAGLSLGLAWSIGRRHRWAGIALGALLGINTYGLGSGLAEGSAAYARPDLAVATSVWLVQLAAACLLLVARRRRRLHPE